MTGSAGRSAGAATSSTEETVDEVVAAVLTASRVLVGVSARSLAQVEESVTLTQFRTLVVLDGHGPSRLNLLAERLDVTASTALRMVDRLIAAGLVDRRENARDRREVVIDLTAEGRRLVRKVTRKRRAEIERIVLGMPVGRRRELVRALVAFAGAADEPAVVAEAASRLGW
ncbi:MarR family winged helix-turn-helix transcriptional regulator [Kribbella sp.]|uniref:MarR family winged helix-turn-helix transcriptional regulator n=1 Tax=Kribbella sp. TaxID=1871183 RepID=UPI002D2BF6A2|nr:MarR family winged helix-turn-helix transcriptional regulator [Kribbella sp.]HZX07900.1 MarR family winged helix-turn-helix transcriptional regulator [Kribbella sp.]